MSVFDRDEQSLQQDLVQKVLDRYDIDDIDINEKPDSHLRADRLLYVIDKVKGEINDLKNQAEESKYFYENEINKKMNNIKYIENMLEYFLDEQDKKTIKLPSGTLKRRTTKKFTYPDNDKLVKFCGDRDIPYKISYKADLLAIKRYIKATGETPEGTIIDEVTTFSYTTKGGQ